MLRQKLTSEELKSQAPFYKYDRTGVPQSFLSTREFVKYLARAADKELRNILIKIGVIQHLLFKRYYEIKNELKFVEWVENKMGNNWQMSYSRPKYREKFKDAKKQKIYSDSVLRNAKINNQQLQQERYYRIKRKYQNEGGGEEIEIPPAMAGLKVWRNYFEQCVNLNQLGLLDNCLVQILVSYGEIKKHNDESRRSTLEYLAKRRKYTQSEIDEAAGESKAASNASNEKSV